LPAQFFNVVVGIEMTTGVFAMTYKIMPRVSVKWRDLWLGYAVTSLLFGTGYWRSPNGRSLVKARTGRAARRMPGPTARRRRCSPSQALSHAMESTPLWVSNWASAGHSSSGARVTIVPANS
jgi:hypothetical protein